MNPLPDTFETMLVKKVFLWTCVFFIVLSGTGILTSLLFTGFQIDAYSVLLLLRGTALVFNCAVLVWLLRTTVPDTVYLRIPPVVTACNFLFSLLTIICTNNNVLVAMGNFLVFSLLYLMIFGFFIRNQLVTAGLGIGIIAGAILLFIVMPDRFFSRKLQIEEIRSAWNYIFVFGLLFTTLLVTLSNQIASMIISKTRETAERLRVMALYDQTTGFPNGLLLEQDMKVFDEMEHPDPKIKLVMVGFRLEGLEALNEIRGLAFTDSLVRDIALTYRYELEAQINNYPEFGIPEPFKTMYRVESNTFVFMLNLPLVGQNDLSSKYLLVSVIDKMILEQQGKINLSFQGGFTIYPDDATSFDQLFRNLLNLLHSRRNESLGEFMPFNPAHYLEFLRQEQLGTCMDEALSTGEFTLAYQPKIEVSSGKLRGFEALARWKSHTLGVVSPGEFIPLAEQTGAIGRLTLHLFDITYDFVRKLRENNHPDIRVSVNLSPGLLNPEFLDRVIDDIEKNGLGPSLEFEITEGVLMKLNSLISTKFNRLKGLGVGFSIDDFGTGYSNLGYLQNFEADVLKIDKRFIDGIPLDEKNSKLVKAIMQMARSFNMLVVAEGVEYQEQRDFLFENECDQIQGYFYSKPLTGEDALKFVSTNK